ncbi:UDP-N-acetylmuramate dehydrogenase, partial [Candidatus Parcubacteria bacterium]|nr:UDP-N-acetylmuramate dehydrogenase [Candidatus Parcubacteria bacterium]
ADYFVRAKNEKELIQIIRWTKKNNLPFFILGGGSNVLFSDEGFRGVVIKIQNCKLKIKNSKIIAGAGCPLQKLIQEAVKNSLSGLEWAAGIPGSLGGAIRGNAGAFGKEMKDVVEKVKVLEVRGLKFKVKELGKEDCRFAYRESIFKRKKDWVILGATLKLKKGKRKEIQEKIREILKLRKEKQPLEFPSAGSVFKNVPTKKLPKKLKEKFKEKIKNGFLPAGVLIEACGLKGKTIGGAKISEKHANFILNFQNASAKDVLKLISLVKRKAKEKFHLKLEEEIEIVKNLNF